MSTIGESTPFGQLLRKRRADAGLSLRHVASTLNISHVYLGEVERGVHRILPRDHWPNLVLAIPGMNIDELEAAARQSEVLRVDMAAVPAQNRALAFAFFRHLDQDKIDGALHDSLCKLLVEKNV